MASVTATIQARLSSSRLPGKVLSPIAGVPMLALQIKRIKMCRLVDNIVIATTDQPADDDIEKLAIELNVGVFRGSEDDVLNRVASALQHFNVDIHLELLGDNPIFDPALAEFMIGYFLKHRNEFDYVSNQLKTTFPPGAEMSVYSAEVLIEAEKLAAQDKLREHTGPHIYQNPDRHRIKNIEAPAHLRYPEMYLEVDTPEDLAVVTSVFEHFLPERPWFSLADAIDFLNDRPELSTSNQGVERRWRSFRQE
jgi:spore coat polysaccharide biosynthesis protein SpsF